MLFFCFVGAWLYAEDMELGDFTFRYGYSFFSTSRRPVQEGGSSSSQKLPGQMKFWLNNKFDIFIRSDTIKASHDAQSWTAGAGDTVIGLDAMVHAESKLPEIDFTYDAKLPTSAGLSAGKVDHEIIVSVLKFIAPHSFEIDMGDYIEGIANAKSAHLFELTISDEIALGKRLYRWTTIQEFDLTTASQDTPFEAYQIFKLKRKINDHFAVAAGMRATYTAYSGRFAWFGTLYVKGRLPGLKSRKLD